MRTFPLTAGLTRFLTAALALACAWPALGQSSAAPRSPDDKERDESVVLLSPFEVSAAGDEGYKAANAISGTRFNTALLDLPRPIDVITAEFIEDIGAKEIGDALRYSGGLSDNGTATPDDITGSNFYNRGFQSFTVYRNGYRSYGISDTMFIDRVEIIKGPSSTFSGTVEPGGTTNVLSRRPSARPTGYMKVRMGSYERSRYELLYSAPVDAGKKFKFLLGAAYEDYGSPYEFSGRRRQIYGGAFQWDPTKTTQLYVDFQWVGTKGVQAVPPIYFISTLNQLATDIRPSFNRAGWGANSIVEQNQMSFDFTQRLGGNWTVRVGGHYRNLNQDRITVAGSTGLSINNTLKIRSVQRTPTWQDANNDNFIVQGSVLGDLKYGAITHKVFCGFEYLAVVDQSSKQYRRPTNLLNISVDTATYADYDIGNRSLYTVPTTLSMLDSIQRGYTVSNIFQMLNNRLLLHQGFRYNTFYQNSENYLARSANSSTQDARVGSYGASYRILPKLTGFVSYAESFTPQTATDFYGNLFGPITGQGWDVGTKFDVIDGRLSGSVVLFQVERSNVLQPDPDHSGYNVASGLDRAKGVEVSVIARPLQSWQTVLSFANIDVKTINDPTRPQNVGLVPPNVAHYQVNLWNRYSFTKGLLKGAGVGVGVIHVGERRGNPNLANIPAYRLPGYTRIDANLTYSRKLFGRTTNFSLALQNLTDQEYFPSYTSLSEPYSLMGTVTVRF